MSECSKRHNVATQAALAVGLGDVEAGARLAHDHETDEAGTTRRGELPVCAEHAHDGVICADG
jgi:hypothetical protein